MPSQHEIRQGETCAHVAAQYGIPEKTIWSDPSNQALRERRKNPNVLFPGDVLTVPDIRDEQTDAGTGQHHRYRRLGVPLKLNLALRDGSGRPLAGRRCELVMALTAQPVTADDDGRIKVEVPPDVAEAELRLDGGTIALAIGHLDPVTELSGWRERLNNLGYGATSSDDEECEQRRYALEEFQCDQGLVVDGICGPKTQARLVEIHGC